MPALEQAHAAMSQDMVGDVGGGIGEEPDRNESQQIIPIARRMQDYDVLEAGVSGR